MTEILKSNYGRVSFIVPTRNSAAWIEGCLSSVRNQDYEDVELVVVDNASTDETVEIARGHTRNVFVAGPERSAQRNNGAKEATGDFLVFLDSDMTVDPGLASEVAGRFRSDRSLSALVIPEDATGEGFWARCRVLEKRIYIGDSTVEAARAFRRSEFDRLHGYDEALTGPEDWDLAERLVDGGGKIGRVDARVTHNEGHLSLQRHLKKKIYYGRSFAQYIRKNPRGAGRRALRGSFIKKLPLLLQDPLHAAGLVVLKLFEVIAVVTGMMLSAVRVRSKGKSPY
jgi:glycosyltransferase involved in cell wall biosynthesis